MVSMNEKRFFINILSISLLICFFLFLLQSVLLKSLKTLMVEYIHDVFPAPLSPMKAIILLFSFSDGLSPSLDAKTVSACRI